MNHQTPVVSLLREQATQGQIELLDTAISEAKSRHTPIYIVGGAVRDLLSSGSTADLDLVTEGDAVEIAKGVATTLGATVAAHRRFGTATVSLGDAHVDFASARQESYTEPAALPKVEPGTLDQDLARRDFTVNAMAISLWPPGATDLIDPYNGRSDLESNALEVLHHRSFIDDPTRILRAIRLEAKSALRLSTHALDLVQDALQTKVFDLLSGDRLRSEIELLLNVPNDTRSMVARLDELHLLQILSPDLLLTSAQMEWFDRLATAPSELASIEYGSKRAKWWLIHLIVLTSSLDRRGRVEVAQRLALQGNPAELLTTGLTRVYELESNLKMRELPPHRVDELLRDSSPEEMLLLSVSKDPNVRKWVTQWHQELRLVALAVTGEDLLASGFEPGPWIGQALTATRNARLDGEIGPEAELGFALEILASAPGRN